MQTSYGNSTTGFGSAKKTLGTLKKRCGNVQTSYGNVQKTLSTACWPDFPTFSKSLRTFSLLNSPVPGATV